MPAEPADQRRRIFFALWPDTARAECLDQAGKLAHAVCGGRRMRRDTLHMTLAFIGDVPVERIGIVQQAAAGVTGPAFTLQLDRLACWRHNHIAWVGCSEPPHHLLTLVGQLTQRLADAGLPLEARDFAAHVTLLRNARCQPMAQAEPISWPVHDFVLAESKFMPFMPQRVQRVLAPGSKLPGGTAEGAHYHLIGRWPLVATAAQVTVPSAE